MAMVAASLTVAWVCLLTVMWQQKDLAADSRYTEILARIKGPLAYDDPVLLELITSEYLLHPPPDGAVVTLTRDKHTAGASIYDSYRRMDYSYEDLQKIIRNIFKNVNNGFFVEAGAVDGEFLSNTLDLEIHQNWTGLLVEADGDMFRHLTKRGRHTWSCHCCLSTVNHPHREVLIKYSSNKEGDQNKAMYARAHGSLASAQEYTPLKIIGIYDDMSKVVPLYESVQCLPLASLLLALGRTHVDFISLDVEGVEPLILSSFPWGDITVDVWVVEHLPQQGESAQPFINIFTSRGYVHAHLANTSNYLNPNYFFIRKAAEKYQSFLKETVILEPSQDMVYSIGGRPPDRGFDMGYGQNLKIK
ncbi:unnamed protein product [Meganyctiphanes norvegica]|uniref:Methyltransferase FkbM domain-containing protein n=1 Tax=Meganyctiphanes norvegica TaxID=48144 RepID=A0AAV2R2C0_MEGNR